MALRKIAENITIPNLADVQAAAPKWESLNCELLTPLHGGGVKARESDKDLPIRVTEIRGGLRFWWRFLAQYKFRLPENEIRETEFALWGGIGEKAQASLVFLRVNMLNKLEMISPPSNDVNLAYALFTTRADKRNNKPEMRLGKAGLKWTLQYAFDNKITPTQKEQVLETLRWWATLGGIGGRTRRGCGVFLAQGLDLVSVAEMEAIGCKILNPKRENPTNILSAWSEAISDWKAMRESHKSQFKKLLGNDNEHSRHLATVFSRPVCVDVDNKQWRGMVIVLPNSSAEVKQILGGSS